MTLQEILDRLEQIKDGLSDVDNRFGIEGTIDDISNLMSDIEDDVEEVNAEERGMF